MKPTVFDRLKNAVNVFFNPEQNGQSYIDAGPGYSIHPDRPRLTRGAERSIVTSVYNKIATDVASIDLKHVTLDENGRYLNEVDSALNNCLTLEANIDQSSRSFKQDIVLSMLDEGVVAIVPVEYGYDPSSEHRRKNDIFTMRVGRVVQWYPRHVRVSVYNDRTGSKEELLFPKEFVAIVENPLYAVMNEPNSTMQRLIRKLILLDSVDEQTSSGKLNIIVQLPYLVKTEARKQQAEQRRIEIENQLASSKYGIAYTDGTEHIQQLNRPLENGLMDQIEYLINLFYSQLGLTKEIIDGTASDTAFTNYYSRTIEPILTAIVLEMKRKFLTKEELARNESIEFFRDPFKLVPVNQIAELSDKMTRNEIMTSNEIRQIIGLLPSSDPNADELRNKNLNQSTEQLMEKQKDEESQNGVEEVSSLPNNERMTDP